MVFRSKVDGFFIMFLFSTILIIGLASFLPLFFGDGIGLSEFVVVTSLFLVITSLILWCAFSIEYVFHQDHLLVKGGPFRSRISYEEITKVSPTVAIFTGYRILSAKNSLELFYNNGFLGSVKISPENRNEFLMELKKRCPDVQIHV